MASEIASAPHQEQLPQQDESTFQQGSSFEAPTMNGDNDPSSANTDDMRQELMGDVAGAAPATEAIITKDITSVVPDPNPAGPTPVDDVASGLAPVADFVPKDASNLSHPTPPPDEPFMAAGEADVDADADVEMAMDEPEVEAPVAQQPASIQSESSLIRPREDDGEDERAAKRSKLEDESQAGVEIAEGVVTDAPAVVEAEESMVVEPVEEPSALLAAEDVISPVVEPAAEAIVEATADSIAVPVAESVTEPVVESAEELVTVPAVDGPSDDATAEVTQSATEPETQLSNIATQSVDGELATATITETPVEERPAETQVASSTQPPEAAPASTDAPKYSSEPMTTVQKNALVEKMKNLKKTKNSTAFLRPVDYMALNIPSYPEIIKNPMDLSTMEAKLKAGEYGSVQDFANDFDLIITNTRRFNGDAHQVTQAGMAMEAYFRRMMESVPSTDMPEPAKPKKRSPSIQREKPPRRESRAAAAPAANAATATSPTYALQPDGTPQIRRESTGRPARAIKPPQNREIPYAKPKRKEHQLELKFCEHVLEEIRGPKNMPHNSVFQMPVDPVALNIPHYRNIIKHPMDLSTMSQKLRLGEYGTANEFKKDFDLIISNCMTFNPVGNPVRDLAVALNRSFQSLWAEKDKWERKNQPASNRASSASGYEDSDGEDEEDAEEEEDEKTATIHRLQKQLAEMQNALAGVAGDGKTKAKKAKGSKSSNKKAGGSATTLPAKKAAPKAAPKPKKPKQISYDEKQEISEAVNNMDPKQIEKLTEIITTNCAKYRDMDEMELEIDDLPNDVQVMLLEYVRRIFGNPNRKKAAAAREPSPDDAAALDDDDFEPSDKRGGGAGGKRKKHKPMGKKEQLDSISTIKKQLAQFQQAATSGSESPTNSSFNNAKPEDTSGDEESEESEEE